jgi:cytochrome c oxidase subunit IV
MHLLGNVIAEKMINARTTLESGELLISYTSASTSIDSTTSRTGFHRWALILMVVIIAIAMGIILAIFFHALYVGGYLG